MATQYTSLLGLALPVTGELSGSWGDVVNDSITSLLDAAVSGTTTLSTDADVTLTSTDGVANEARSAIIVWDATGTVTRNITAPAHSKAYFVINKTGGTQSIVIRGAGPTTGVTVLAGTQSLVVWNGADFVEIASGNVDGPASSTDNAIARFDGTTGKLIQNSVVTIADTTGNMAGVGLLSAATLNLTNALTTAYGGTGLTSFTAGDLPYYATGTALSKLAIGANGYVLQSNGTAPTWVVASSVVGGAAGSNTQVQFNNSGALGASANLTFDGAQLGVNGITVGRGAGAVATNTAVGASALAANTSGTQNVSVGTNSLLSNTSASFNTSVGVNNLYSNTTGANNTAFGSSAAFANTTGSNNTAVGREALQANTTASNNTAVGFQALYSNTTANNNTAVGYQSGYTNTTGEFAALGYQALYNNTTGLNNAAFGRYRPLYSNTTGAENSAFGDRPLYSNTTGNYNTALGSNSLYSNTTASNNTAVGYQAGYGGTTYPNTVSIGSQAGFSLTTSANDGSVFVGYIAGNKNTTGGQNVFLGRASGYNNTTASFNAFVGDASGFANTTGASNTALGADALFSNTTASNNTAVGYQAGYSNTTGTVQTFIGFQAGYAGPINGGEVYVGAYAGNSKTTGTDVAASTFVGYSAGRYTTTGIDNSVFGSNSLQANTTGSKNTALGTQALLQSTTGSNNTSVGLQSLYSNTTASNNTAVGYQAGYNNTTGTLNTFVGANSGQSTTTGGSNTFLGLNAGYYVTTGGKNTIVGQYTGNAGGLDIRTASNYIVLSDGDGNPRAWFQSGGVFNCTGVRDNTTATAGNVGVDGDGLFYRSTSALKYKQDIRDIEEMDISLLRPVRYKSKCANDDKTKDHFGVVADEAADAGFEELITRGATGEVEGFQYERLTVVLLKSLQTLKAEFDAYKAAHP